MKYCFVGLLFTLLFAKSSFAQYPSYVQYKDASSGLSTREVYELMQDSRHYIWALTDYGIHRFNGERFEVFEVDSILSGSIPIDVLEAEDGTIWFYFYNGLLAHYNYATDTLTAYSKNEELANFYREHSLLQTGLNNSLRLTNDNTIVFSLYHSGFIELYSDSFHHHIQDKSFFHTVMEYKGVPMLLSPTGFNQEVAMLKVKFIHEDSTSHRFLSQPDDYLSGGTNIYRLQGDDRDFLCLGTTLVSFREDSILTQRLFRRQIIAAKVLPEERLMLSMSGQPLIIVDQNSLETIDSLVVPFNYVSSTIVDAEGGQWYSTLHDGVYHVPSPKIKRFSPLRSKNVSALYFYKNRLYYGTSDGEVGYLKDEKLISLNGNKPERMELIQRFFEIDNQLCFSTKKRYFKINFDHSITPGPASKYRMAAKDFLVRNDTLIFARRNGIHILHQDHVYRNNVMIVDANGTFTKVAGINEKPGIQSICELDGNLIAASKNFVLLTQLNTGLADTLYTLPQSIHFTRTDPSSSLLYCATKRGVYVISEAAPPRLIFSADGFSINSMYIKKKVVWLGSANGLFKLVPDSNGHYEALHFGQRQGLHEANISCLEITEDHVYAGTSSGIICIPHDALITRSARPVIRLATVKNGETSVASDLRGHFNYQQSSLTFSVDLLTSNGRNDIEFQYRINQDQQWQTTQKHQLEFPFLSPGDYHFQIRACNGSNCSEFEEYWFTVTPPFWMRWELQLIAVITLLLGLYAYYRNRIKKLEKSRKTEEKITLLERKAMDLHQQALKAQINPHFLFNALSSIQSFIIDNKVEESERYLNDYSHLMRLILESSTDQFIPLEKEVKLLNSYLRLEQMRLDFSFEFNIHCDEDLLEEGLKVPSMILQPLIENAIVHGIPNHPNGKIQVHFIESDQSPELLLCRVEDNGKGIQRNESSQPREYESKATKIITERLQILNAKDGDKMVRFTDLATVGSGQETGTRVEVYLPLRG